MKKEKFKKIRARLEKTQKEMSQLLGVSIKAIHSYEQGWRTIPHHVERHLLFLLSKFVLKDNIPTAQCWDTMKCSDETKEKCPAWEFKAGNLCWFINGTKCKGKVYNSWKDKMIECKQCKVFKSFFDEEI